MLLDASSTMALCDGFPFTNSDISTAFNVANFGPQPLWLLMILIPNTKITKLELGKNELLKKAASPRTSSPLDVIPDSPVLF